MSLPEIACLQTVVKMQTKSLKAPLSGSTLEISKKHSRHFSEEFRRQKVKEITEKTIKIKDLCALYDISRTTVYKWIYLYSPHHERGTKQVIEMESEATKTKYFQQRVAELERVVGLKQMEIDYLNVLITEGSKALGVDFKKKFAPKPSNGFDKTSESIAI
jgi:transposase